VSEGLGSAGASDGGTDLQGQGVMFTERHEEAEGTSRPVTQGSPWTSCNLSIFSEDIEKENTSYDILIVNKLEIHQTTFYDMLNINKL
jgi:hypothetical protein